ncbi:DUF294 nucleotidyltransferase-like domain-containing protein [Desulfogranum mediterraneum]|uniref:DUF294 nucleotidyltransferase-like domain-containing protein n=1 Tax=Desulfogranum mediterraneum TaxID=160661 RepID=UPI0004297040|nr:DUF294 nucleotidyltransferase-like domain-containing protein [Desulfogranum mediterraneum]
MEAELIEIVGFVSQFPPFDSLPEEALEEAVQQVEISYHRAGSIILNYGDPIHHLYMIRSGAVEVFRRNGNLYNRLDEGDLFGQYGLLMNNTIRFPAKAMKDTLLYSLPERVFSQFCERYESFSDFVELEGSSRLRQAVTTISAVSDLITSKVTTLLTREAFLVPGDISIQEVARIMSAEPLSAVLVIDSRGEGETLEEGAIAGILTDRDLCTRVVACGLPGSTPAEEVMSTELVSLDHNAYVYEAMLTMLRCNIQHLPVLRKGVPLGVVEISDLVRYESQNSLLLVNSIFQQPSVSELISLSQQVKDCFVRLVHEDANSHMIGSAMAVIGRSFIQRLAELAEEFLGEPPVPYCFLTLGSMARDEQLVVTDQDNALILDNDYDPKEHGQYFLELTTFICDGLAACGYPHCSGEIMASNEEWRKTRRQWEACFSDWLDNPQPQALLHSSIFFDLDGVWGRLKWAEQLNRFIARRARENGRFLACLARNALNRKPPLGFFKDFVMEKDGRQRGSMNLKRRGTAPLADIIRVHALAVGSCAQNSFERLEEVIDAGILPQGRGADLRDAMEFISMVRIRHQALDLQEGVEADNNIEPENLSDFERRHLKDAFQIVSNAQNFLKFCYQGGRLS